jgi:hypothetical protein
VVVGAAVVGGVVGGAVVAAAVVGAGVVGAAVVGAGVVGASVVTAAAVAGVGASDGVADVVGAEGGALVGAAGAALSTGGLTATATTPVDEPEPAHAARTPPPNPPTVNAPTSTAASFRVRPNLACSFRASPVRRA